MYTQRISQRPPTSNRDKDVNSFLVALSLTPAFLLSPYPESCCKMVSFIIIQVSRPTDQKMISIERIVCYTHRPQEKRPHGGGHLEKHQGQLGGRENREHMGVNR